MQVVPRLRKLTSRTQMAEEETASRQAEGVSLRGAHAPAPRGPRAFRPKRLKWPRRSDQAKIAEVPQSLVAPSLSHRYRELAGS